MVTRPEEVTKKSDSRHKWKNAKGENELKSSDDDNSDLEIEKVIEGNTGEVVTSSKSLSSIFLPVASTSSSPSALPPKASPSLPSVVKTGKSKRKVSPIRAPLLPLPIRGGVENFVNDEYLEMIEVNGPKSNEQSLPPVAGPSVKLPRVVRPLLPITPPLPSTPPPPPSASSPAEPAEDTGNRPLASNAQKVLEKLVSLKNEPITEAVKKLIVDDKKKMRETCFFVLKGFVTEVKDPKRRGKVAKKLLELFADPDSREFALQVINSNVLEKGRIHSIHTLDYVDVSVYVFADALFTRTDLRVASLMVPRFPKERVIDLIKFLAVNFEKPAVILAKMQTKDCFESYDLALDPEKWHDWKVKMVVDALCRDIRIESPIECRPLTAAVVLGPCVEAHCRDEVEIDDFINICRNLANNDDDMWEIIVECLDERCPNLANAVAAFRQTGNPQRENFVSKCKEPRNVRFHALPHRDGVMVNNVGIVTRFTRDLRDSEHFAVDFHGTACLEDSRGRIGVATFVFRRGIYYVMPTRYAEFIPSIVAALREAAKPMFVLRWEGDKKNFLKSFLGYVPPKIVEAHTVAREQGKSTSFDDMIKEITGGPLCKRASFFGDSEEPTDEALRHRSMRGCGIYDTVVIGRNLREKRDDSLTRAHDAARARDRERAHATRAREDACANARERPSEHAIDQVSERSRERPRERVSDEPSSRPRDEDWKKKRRDDDDHRRYRDYKRR